VARIRAQQVATIQTLLATCRAHEIDAYTYLVDVLQRINQSAPGKPDQRARSQSLGRALRPRPHPLRSRSQSIDVSVQTLTYAQRVTDFATTIRSGVGNFFGYSRTVIGAWLDGLKRAMFAYDDTLPRPPAAVQ
jgi:hypothetical protein